jgi:hypothetical protein
MRRFVISLLGLALCLSANPKKRKQAKPPDIEVMESTGRRLEGIVALDGRVRNTSGKPIGGLTLIFDFIAPGKLVITTQKTSIDEEVLDPGKESVFRVQLTDPVRAVKYQLSAVDADGRDLRVANAGPFVIE